MPVMQTFRMDLGPEEAASGAFVTAIDLFFKTKSSNLGITCELLGVKDGMPTPALLPFSKVHKKASEINVSDDGQTATTFTFQSPVFLPTTEEFAFSIMADNHSPDYTLWVAKTGETDISTSQPINADAFSGNLFLGARQPSLPRPVVDEDIKFTLHRANFTPNTGIVSVQNKDYEFFTVNDIFN